MPNTNLTAVKRLVRTMIHFSEDFANIMDSDHHLHIRDHTKSIRRSDSNGMVCLPPSNS